MYAIIRTGGKQAKVRPGDVIDVELLKGASEEVEFEPLLVVDEAGKTHAGRDALGEAKVTAKIVGDSKGPKIDLYTYKSKSGNRRHIGHRQHYTTIEVTAIDLGTAKKKTPAKPAASDAAADNGADTEET
ncbi:MAG TPA: 50S ribosomal protein L21 [Acidimicrobiia bacterium]|jgi:large subunit ribosomal protein L21|nr:50S ribosomal protein L21 [Acidimicrobiia bacterium]